MNIIHSFIYSPIKQKHQLTLKCDNASKDRMTITVSGINRSSSEFFLASNKTFQERSSNTWLNSTAGNLPITSLMSYFQMLSQWEQTITQTILYGNYTCLPSNTLHIFSSYQFRISNLKLEILLMTPTNHCIHPSFLPNTIL